MKRKMPLVERVAALRKYDKKNLEEIIVGGIVVYAAMNDLTEREVVVKLLETHDATAFSSAMGKLQ